MGGPAYHGWTHRPKSEGGTDPIPGLGGGAGAWIRLGMSDDFDFPAAQRNAVEWDVIANPFPTFYDTVNSGIGGTDNAVDILQNGLYAVTFGMYLDTFTPLIPTNSNCVISFQHTTWTTEEEAFPFLLDNALINNLASPILTGSKVFRSGPDYNAVYMCVTTDDAADSNLGFVGGDLNVTYMEIVRLAGLSDDSFQGDPNDFAVFPP